MAEYLLSPDYRRQHTAIAADRLLHSKHYESLPVHVGDNTTFMGRPFQ